MGTSDTPTKVTVEVVDTSKVVATPGDLGLSVRAMSYAKKARSSATLRAYRSDWQHFEQWATSNGHEALPAAPTTVAEYLTDLADAGSKPSTISRRVASISVAHETANYPTPTTDVAVKVVITGIRRDRGTTPREAAPITLTELRRMMAATPTDSTIGLRDRALLLVGFALGARRSELVALDVDDLTEHADGLQVRVRRSKVDQEGRGDTRALPYGSSADTCPVRALTAWLEAAGIEEGPIFRGVTRHGTVRSGRLNAAVVAQVVKARAEAAGLDPTRFSGHSLRAGFVTEAARRGASERAISRQTGHAPNSAVLRRYVRHADAFTENAATALGL